MALRIAKPDEMLRQYGMLYWVEDLERAGLTYGDLLCYLEGLHVECVCSPIHDRDTYTADDVRAWCKRHIDPDTGEVATEYTNRTPQVGQPKKPHIHIYFKCPGKKKPIHMSQLMEDFIPYASNRWVVVPDFAAIVRYCAHMDSPEKAQYDPAMIHGFANVDMSAIWEHKSYNKMKVLTEIDEQIQKSRITNYHRLNRWAMGTGDVDIISTVTGRHGYYTSIFNAMRQEKIDRANAKKKGSQNDENGA